MRGPRRRAPIQRVALALANDPAILLFDEPLASLDAQTRKVLQAELVRSPDLIQAAKGEFDKSRGPSFVYKPLIGDRQPPLDYRKGSTSTGTE